MGAFLSGVAILFSRLLDHSVEISVLICLIFFVKWVAAKKLPPWWHYSLWLMLLIRMLVPIEFENSLNVFNFIPDIRENQVFELITDSSSENGISAAEITSKAPPNRSNWRFLLKNSVPMLWLAGAMVLGISILIRSISFWRSVRRLPPVTDKKVLHLLVQCKNRMKISVVMDVIVTDRVRSPALFGYFHPRLLMPKGIFEGLSDEDLSYAFMHELGHLKRHDIGVSLLAAVLQAVYWFNPLVWIAFYQMRIDQESACDESVLSRIKRHQSADYAKAIVGFLEKFYQNCQLPSLAGVMENKTQMKRRIANIVHHKKGSRKLTVAAVALLIFTGFILSLFTGAAKEKQMQSAMEPEVEKSFVAATSADDGEVSTGDGIIPANFSELQAEVPQNPLRLTRSDIPESNGKAEYIPKAAGEDPSVYANHETFFSDHAGAQDEVTPIVGSRPIKDLENFSVGAASFPKSENSSDSIRIVEKTAELSVDAGDRTAKADFPAMIEPERKPETARKKEPSAGTGSSSSVALMTAVGSGGVSPEAFPAKPRGEFAEKWDIETNRTASVPENGQGDSGEQAVFQKSGSAPGSSLGRAVDNSETAASTGNGKVTADAASETVPGSEVFDSVAKTDLGKDRSDAGFPMSDVDIPPRLISAISPQYPFRAKRDEIAGYIKLRFTVTKDGDAIDTTVVESNPEGVFDKSALEALESYRFKPGIKDGKAVDVQVSLPIKFKLS